MNTPRYWRDETSGVLYPVIEAYLTGGVMTERDLAVMRAYLRQWIMCPVWYGEDVAALRRRIDGLDTRTKITRWLDDAERVGIDPL